MKSDRRADQHWIEDVRARRLAARKPQTPPPLRPDWRTTNPGYAYSPPRRVKVNGVPCVELDGGSLADMAYTVARRR